MLKRVFINFLIILSIILLILPFLTTFNNLITNIFLKIRIYNLIQEAIVPHEARMVVLILNLLSIQASIAGATIFLEKGEKIYEVYLSWNCIGWQSLVLFLISLATGLRGNFKIFSKIKTILFGVLGTFWVNLLRISLVVIFAFFFGQLPAVIFHDYGSTLMIIAWLFLFWWFSYNFILED